MRTTYLPLAIIALSAVATSGSAQLYSEDFDVENSANWVVNKSHAASNSNADFFFDYSTVGIDSAPNSGGTTRGLRMDANVNSGIFSGISVSPLGENFAGDYKLTADVWLNFIGPAPNGGSGSTQAGGMGIGTRGDTSQWAGGTQDSVHFSATGDGNSSADWRAYSSAAGSGYADGSTVFSAVGAGNRNHNHAYYAGFGANTPPVAQATLFPTQIGTTLVGSAGFEWHAMVVEKAGNLITWTVSGTQIAQVDASTVTLGGGNILLNYYDTNTGSTSTTTGMNFILFDNVVVVPEPGTFVALGLGALVLLRRRKK